MDFSKFGSPAAFFTERRKNADPGQPLPGGFVLSDYKIERILHRGGMSWVYRARDNRGTPVVLKEFFPHRSAFRNEHGVVPRSDRESYFEEGFRRFHEEGRLLGLFRGGPFLRTRQFFYDNNTGYLVLELERGRTLASYIRIPRQYRHWSIAKPFVGDVWQGLCRMHDQKILHLDIHPGNIFLSLQGKGLLLDFGASRHMAEPAINDSRFFTQGFSAPEIHRLGKLGPWTDVYSFGACLKACGALRNPLWPAEVRELTLSCLREQPSERPQSFSDGCFQRLLS